MTTDIEPPSAHAVAALARRRRVDGDTAAAVAASLIGAASVTVSAIGIIRLCVEPLGFAPVLVAGAATGVVVTVLLAGGVSAWMRDRAGRRA